MNLILEEIEKYCSKHTIPDSHILTELKNYTQATEAAPQMICGNMVGGILQFLIQISNSKKILEIGMFTGYSALKMAEAIPHDGEIHTCELYDNHIKTASTWFEKSNHKDKITIHSGNAIQSIKQFEVGSIDLLFVDADKLHYPQYFKKGLKLLKSGGIGVFDNMLWGGSVLNPKDKDSKAIDTTNKLIKNSDSVIQLLLPVRDGIMIFQKK